jgi:hypothetical protein
MLPTSATTCGIRRPLARDSAPMVCGVAVQESRPVVGSAILRDRRSLLQESASPRIRCLLIVDHDLGRALRGPTMIDSPCVLPACRGWSFDSLHTTLPKRSNCGACSRSGRGLSQQPWRLQAGGRKRSGHGNNEQLRRQSWRVCETAALQLEMAARKAIVGSIGGTTARAE